MGPVENVPSADSEGVKNPKRGVFWVIDNKLHAYPFEIGSSEGVAKSGNTFNHRLLWASLGLSGKPYNYYPRGRVHIDSRGRAVIYLNPNIAANDYIEQIAEAFDLKQGEYRVRVDCSSHYCCHLDEGWEAN